MFLEAETQSVAQNELEAGEKLLWTGKPDPRRALIAAAPIWLIALPCLAFVLFWMWNMLGAGENLTQPSAWPNELWFSVPGLLTCFVMMASPFWEGSSARRTICAITDKRVLIVEDGRTKTVQSFSGKDLGEIKRVERRDGSGDLAFAERVGKDSDGDKITTDTKFIGIANVRGVDELLRATFKR